MSKTYPAIGPFAPGDILAAATMTNIDTNLDNQRVPPMCLVKRTANSANLSQNTTNTVDFSTSVATEVFDTDGMHSLVTNASRITPTTAGVYTITGTLQLTASFNFCDVRIVKNGSTQLAVARLGTQAGGVVSAVDEFNGTTDYVEMILNVGTGTSQITTANSLTTLGAIWNGQTA